MASTAAHVGGNSDKERDVARLTPELAGMALRHLANRLDALLDLCRAGVGNLSRTTLDRLRYSVKRLAVAVDALAPVLASHPAYGAMYNETVAATKTVCDAVGDVTNGMPQTEGRILYADEPALTTTHSIGTRRSHEMSMVPAPDDEDEDGSAGSGATTGLFEQHLQALQLPPEFLSSALHPPPDADRDRGLELIDKRDRISKAFADNVDTVANMRAISIAAPSRKRHSYELTQGRPRIALDPVKVQNLLGEGCSMKEVAAILKVSARTLRRRCADHKIRKRPTATDDQIRAFVFALNPSMPESLASDRIMAALRLAGLLATEHRIHLAVSDFRRGKGGLPTSVAPPVIRKPTTHGHPDPLHDLRHLGADQGFNPGASTLPFESAPLTSMLPSVLAGPDKPRESERRAALDLVGFGLSATASASATQSDLPPFLQSDDKDIVLQLPPPPLMLQQQQQQQQLQHQHALGLLPPSLGPSHPFGRPNPGGRGHPR